MKVYQNDCELTIENMGTSILGILRGTPEAIRETFNGLWNLMATNGELSWETDSVAIFWTNPTNLKRFFVNRILIPIDEPTEVEKDSARQSAENSFAELVKTAEVFLRDRKPYSADLFHTGTMRAEKPDADMKDAILSHAFKDKETVDSEPKAE